MRRSRQEREPCLCECFRKSRSNHRLPKSASCRPDSSCPQTGPSPSRFKVGVDGGAVLA